MTTVNVGSDATFTDATSGHTDKNIALLGKSLARYSVANKEAQSFATSAVADLERWSLAEVWKTFTVSGASQRFADISISGDYGGSANAIGGASSRIRFRIFLYDVTDGTSVDRYTVANKDVAFVGHFPFAETFSQNVSGYLQPDHKYRAGVRVETWASALSLAWATSDTYEDIEEDNNDGIRYSSIDLKWV